jgi:hypothetical protein
VCGSRRSDLADAVPSTHTDDAIRIGRVREQLQNRHKPGRDNEWLGDGSVANGVSVGIGAKVGKIHAGHC